MQTDHVNTGRLTAWKLRKIKKSMILTSRVHILSVTLDLIKELKFFLYLEVSTWAIAQVLPCVGMV